MPIFLKKVWWFLSFPTSRRCAHAASTTGTTATQWRRRSVEDAVSGCSPETTLISTVVLFVCMPATQKIPRPLSLLLCRKWIVNDDGQGSHQPQCAQCVRQFFCCCWTVVFAVSRQTWGASTMQHAYIKYRFFIKHGLFDESLPWHFHFALRFCWHLRDEDSTIFQLIMQSPSAKWWIW